MPPPLSLTVMITRSPSFFVLNELQVPSIFLSTINGTGWTEVNNGLPSDYFRSLAICGNSLFAGTYASGVFLSTTNGANWTAVNDNLPTNTQITMPSISRISFCAAHLIMLFFRPSTLPCLIVFGSKQESLDPFSIFPAFGDAIPVQPDVVLELVGGYC